MKKFKQKIIIIFLLLLSGVLGFSVSLYRHADKREDAEIQQIETFHYPATFVKQLVGDPLAGRKIFQQFCASCHGNPPIIDIKAPRIGDKKAWRIRRQMGMSTLMKITTMGVGAMPARGGCFECSDLQLQEAIQYMLSSS